MSKLLIGLAAGVALGILFAPDKGSSTRQKIADKSNDLKDRFNDFIDTLSNKVDDMEEEAQDFASRAKSQF